MSSPAISLSLASYASIIAARISGSLSSSAATSTTTAASNTATASTQGGGIILSATSPPNAASAAQSALMELNANNPLTGSSLASSLLNDAAQQLQSTRALPPELLKPQVIEALVLKSTLLATPGSGTTQAPQTQPATLPANPQAQQQAVAQAKVELAWQGRVLQLLSAQPLPVGSQVRIEVTARGELKLLPPQLANATPNTPTTARPAEPALPLPLQQSLRENLPRQRALTEMQPLLQRLLSPTALPKLPAPVAAALQQLAASLPRPQQLQSADGVRQAVQRSGNFLEARVTLPAAPGARSATAPQMPQMPPISNSAERLQPLTGGNAKPAAPGDTATPPRAAASVDSELLRTAQATADAAADGDLKAQLLQLVAMIRRFAPAAPGAPLETLPDQLYSARPQPKEAPAAIPVDGGERELEQLQQLSRLLQGGLARIQMNQLDGAASRVAGGNDGQPPVPSWNFELPLQTPRGGDTLQLRIEQQARQQEGVRKMQWKVQLAFDLHELGKLAATLTITGSNVAATLWAEQQHTHRVVRAEVDHFKAALEGVGVQVTEVQCRLGLPPEQKHRWQQQLVDVRT